MAQHHPGCLSSRGEVLPGSAAAREAMARLHYLVDRRHRLGLVLGDASGRRWALETFRDELAKRPAARPCQVLLVRAAGMDLAQLLRRLTAELGPGRCPTGSVSELWRRLADGISENRVLGRHTVILLDDVHRAASACLAHLARITQLGRPPGGGLTTVLAICPQPHAGLEADVLELVDLEVHLAEWTPAAGVVPPRANEAA